ncbi:MAG: U32 family peptidase [Paludibacteraceae bacterium]|nr:U32 family peptidase [Paludibacteraceae bacterium]MBR0064128.1 U32 family peptidase [Paludibacteraceae bacterium]
MTTHHSKISLLSPARDKQVAFAAIQAGADAVYIGAPAFGARQAAGNSLEDLAEVVRYAHTYGVQVLVTLNTLLHDDEYEQAVALAHALYSIGVDALIIQDLRLLDFDLPPIRLHASTQCDNRTPGQVKRLRDMGFKRVVLARELGIEEIRAIHLAVPDIELEAFVHGALCVSYSGRCYISEVLAGRSANRGACAQFCRMAYDLLDEQQKEVLDEYGKPVHQRYLLSLQDMDRSAYLAELIEAGVTTFKIEGRLKDADYVTNITAYYREKLDSLLSPIQRGVVGVFTRSFTPAPEKTFHRGGIDYFLHGRTPHMANWLTPKSTGEYIGEVLEVRGNTLRVRLKEGIALHNGDGLTIGSEGCSVNGVEGNIIKVNHQSINPSFHHSTIPLFRNLDAEFVRLLHSERRIPVDILFRETKEGFELSYTPLNPALSPLVGRVGKGMTFEEARNPQKAMETIRTQLAKLGDTPYQAREIQIACKPCFFPISVLNDFRRQVLSAAGSACTQREKPQMPQWLNDPINVPMTDAPMLNAPKVNVLMECKYCLLFEMGHCRKTNPFPKAKEPRFLRLRTGKMLRLTFDCPHCRMLVTEADRK